MHLSIGGDVYTILTSGQETAEAYTVMHAHVPPGGGPPLHVHSREDEAFYIVEGELTFFVEDEIRTAGPGEFLRVGVGVKHRFENQTDKSARLLITAVPAGLERFFVEIGHAMESADAVVQPYTEADGARLVERAPAYGIQIL